MSLLRVGSLCAGIGGLDLGLGMVLDTDLAWVSEIDEAPAAILARHFLDVPNLGDLTAVDWTAVEPVDVLTAGYPCQPFSTAGKRQGTNDARHLRPHIADAVRVPRPRLVLLENVTGHLSLGFGAVVADLADEGYRAPWTCLRASDVGAPHGRLRVVIGAAADTDGGGFGGHPGAPAGRDSVHRDERYDPDGCGDASADSARIGWAEGGAESARLQGGSDAVLGCSSAPSDTERSRRDGRARAEGRGEGGRTAARRNCENDRGDDGPEIDRVAWGVYEPAIRRWEPIVGRPAPAPTDARGRLSPDLVEWMMGYPAGWTDVFPARMEVPTRKGGTRLLTEAQTAGRVRNLRLKALGNAVVPQQAAAAVTDLLGLLAGVEHREGALA